MSSIKTVLVSFDSSNNVLIVGEKKPRESVDIINAIKGPEAAELFNKLITKKGE